MLAECSLFLAISKENSVFRHCMYHKNVFSTLFFFGFSHKSQKWYSPLISWFSSLLSHSHQCISLFPSDQALTFVLRSLGLSGRIVFLHLSHPFFKSYSFWFLIPPFRVHPAMVIHFSFIGTLTAFLFFSGLLYIPSDMASCISSNILHCLVQFFLSDVKGVQLWIIHFLSTLWDSLP